MKWMRKAQTTDVEESGGDEHDEETEDEESDDEPIPELAVPLWQ